MTLSIPHIRDDAGALEAALLYAGAGLYIGPAKRRSKNPGGILGEGWQHQTSRDPDQIAAWFAGRDDSVFIHAGRSGLLIFDVSPAVPTIPAAGITSSSNPKARRWATVPASSARPGARCAASTASS